VFDSASRTCNASQMWGRLCGRTISVVAIARGSAGIFYRRFSGRDGKKSLQVVVGF